MKSMIIFPKPVKKKKEQKERPNAEFAEINKPNRILELPVKQSH